MRKWLVGLGVLALILVAAGGLGLALFLSRYPHVGRVHVIRIEPTPRRLARGRYLANHVTGCINCHSNRQWQYFSGPVEPGTEGRGGERFGEEFGFPGTFYAANITPSAIGSWTDTEIFQAITCGVTNTGRAMSPVMPYRRYRRLSQDDAEALVVYIRTLAPIVRASVPSRVTFPMNLIVRTIPQSYAPRPAPDRTNRVAYGEYLTTIAACEECHTPVQQGRRIAESYAGGTEFAVPRGGVVRAANITPDRETGIGDWPEDFFIAMFRDFTSERRQRVPVAPGQLNTIMPWTMYAGMTDEDLGAIYLYLRTVKPVRHVVEKFSAPGWQ